MRFIIIFFLLISVIPNSANAKEVLVVKKTNGEIFDLSKLEDKVVVVTLWASWCSNCYAEMLKLERIRKIYPKSRLEILALNLDDLEDNKNKPLELMKKFSFDMAFASDAKLNSLESDGGIPTTYIMSKNKTLIDPPFLEKAIEEQF